MMVRKKLSIIDAIGIILIVLGISMTVLNFLAARGPAVSIESFSIRAIAPHPSDNNI